MSPRRRFALVLIAVVSVAAWLPIMAVLATLAMATVTGCQVDESTVRPCIVAGHDIGEALATGLLLAFVAGPALLIALATSIAWVVVWRGRRLL